MFPVFDIFYLIKGVYCKWVMYSKSEIGQFAVQKQIPGFIMNSGIYACNLYFFCD
jgi:hypothetical protein